jgi:ubiquinone/menaquinone biosynthesis C-methylase UbiE
MEADPGRLKTLYGNRFGTEGEARHDLWRVLTEDFFQRWVPRDSVVVDIAAGHCEFVNNIVAGTRIAVDLNPDVTARAAAGVRAIVARSDAIAGVEDRSVDRVFISNFFEHVTRDTILSTLAEARRILRPDGKLLILQPNIRYCAKDFWMFFDHVTPVDDRALVEALNMSSFDVELCLARFLPYTTKSRLPTTTTLVRLYLKMPLAWRLLGAQAFVVATPSGPGIVRER